MSKYKNIVDLSFDVVKNHTKSEFYIDSDTDTYILIGFVEDNIFWKDEDKYGSLTRILKFEIKKQYSYLNFINVINTEHFIKVVLQNNSKGISSSNKNNTNLYPFGVIRGYGTHRKTD